MEKNENRGKRKDDKADGVRNKDINVLYPFFIFYMTALGLFFLFFMLLVFPSTYRVFIKYCVFRRL